MLVWFDFIFLGDLNKCFPHFRSWLFFFPPPLTCSRQQCYICILFLLTVFKEERANLQYNRQSGAMFQDEKRSLFINLRGSRFPARSIPAEPHPPRPGWRFGFFSNRCKQPIPLQSTKKKIMKDLFLVVEFLVLQDKRIEQPESSTWSPCWYLSALAQNHLLSTWKSACPANELKKTRTQ